MPEKKKTLTEAQKKAAAFLTRAKPDFDGWRAAREAKAEAAAVANAKVGDVMPDGTIYAGISPDANERMYVTAHDVSLSMDFNAAAKYTEELYVHGHQDWKMPTPKELRTLFRSQKKGVLKGTFTTIANFNYVYPDWYWSSAQRDDLALALRFSDGLRGSHSKDVLASCRPVRFVPTPK